MLSLNAGSSSVKFAVFDGARALLRGQLSGVGGTPKVEAQKHGETLDPPRLSGSSQDDLLPGLMDWLDQHVRIEAAGHRVVHGGMRFTEPVQVDDGVMAALDALVELAPLHQPHSLAGLRAVAAARPALPQVACFDTAFHRTMPPVAVRLPVPRDLHQAGVRRYGFHGLSYEWIAGRLRLLDPVLAPGRVVVAHLGSGASLCALHYGHSVGTTMGMTALDGIMMATRSGALDPGVLLYLMQSRGMDAAAIEDLLYHNCGLLGVSAISGDMRRLHDDPAGREAIDLFVHRLVSEIGALAAGMGGLDGVVFTAGIGEHDAAVRRSVCTKLGWLGIEVDPACNQAADRVACLITRAESRVRVWMIPTDEEAVIARHTASVLTLA